MAELPFTILEILQLDEDCKKKVQHDTFKYFYATLDYNEEVEKKISKELKVAKKLTNKFHTRQATEKELNEKIWTEEYMSFSSGSISPSEFYNFKINIKLEMGKMFAYLFRRFGKTNCGYDSYKELYSYYLITPNSDIFLRITPRDFHPFGICLKREDDYKLFNIIRKRNRKYTKEEIEFIQNIEDNLYYTMLDLFCPTFVRDEYFNIASDFGIKNLNLFRYNIVKYFDEFDENKNQ